MNISLFFANIPVVYWVYMIDGFNRFLCCFGLFRVKSLGFRRFLGLCRVKSLWFRGVA